MGCARAEAVKKECLNCPVCMKAIGDANTVSRVFQKGLALDRELVKQGKPPAFEKSLKESISPLMGLERMARSAESLEPVLDSFMRQYGLTGGTSREKRPSLSRLIWDAREMLSV